MCLSTDGTMLLLMMALHFLGATALKSENMNGFNYIISNPNNNSKFTGDYSKDYPGCHLPQCVFTTVSS